MNTVKRVRSLLLTAAGLAVAATSIAGQTPTVPPPPPVEPSSAAPITLDTFTQLALERHPRLAQSVFAVDAARGRALQAGLYPNPTVQITGDEIGDRTGPSGIWSPYLNQEIVRAGKLRLGRAAATREVDQLTHTASAQRYTLLADVRMAYYDALALQVKAELLDAAVRHSDEAVAAVRKLVEAKQVSRLDLVLIVTNGERLRADLEATRAELPAAVRRLVAVTGAPELRPARLTGSLDPPFPTYELDQTQSLVLASHPDVLAAQAAEHRARFLVEKARADAVPNVTLSAGYTRQGQNRSNDWGVGVIVPIPVWNKNQGNIREATARLGDAALEVRRVEADLTDKIASAFRVYASAVRRAERYRTDVVPHAREAYNLAVQAYRAGQYSYAQLVEAQRGAANANLDFIAALAEAWKAAAALSGLRLEEIWPPPPPPPAK